MRLRTVAALLATTATALTLTACGQESDAAKNAVAVACKAEPDPASLGLDWVPDVFGID